MVFQSHGFFKRPSQKKQKLFNILIEIIKFLNLKKEFLNLCVLDYQMNL